MGEMQAPLKKIPKNITIKMRFEDEMWVLGK